MNSDCARTISPPDEPHPSECCNRGCCPCIFDYYRDAVSRWQAAVAEIGQEPITTP